MKQVKKWFFEVFDDNTGKWYSVESPKSNKGQLKLSHEKRFIGKRMRYGFNVVSA